MTGQFDRQCERCGCHLTENVTDLEHSASCPNSESEAVRSAVAQERERCAKIAEAKVGSSDPYCCDTVAENIAAEIRKGTP